MFKFKADFLQFSFFISPPSFAKILVVVDVCTFKSKMCFNLFAIKFLPLAILINFDCVLREAFLDEQMISSCHNFKVIYVFSNNNM
ncbi:hypothetical protein AAJ76_3000109576 [Vairimorpha ceranae]|uniref:Uncharacterized protein n=1 Tax=Vairimorpha ceranae TaxID=40302 RepID=A0A0F9WIR2_9MICR|nr:hypothetical protein AAJ76_3000109576 [Vairimorpha ceranae]KKO76450.1 hypothetical protein AAJ76_3000109576 [Vairimorpha ceranae]